MWPGHKTFCISRLETPGETLQKTRKQNPNFKSVYRAKIETPKQLINL